MSSLLFLFFTVLSFPIPSVKFDSVNGIISFRFCMRYDFQHRGVINYKDFLERLGLSVERQRAPAPDNASGG